MQVVEGRKFDKAKKELPICAFGNFDPLSHKTVADLVWCARHELDMIEEEQDGAAPSGNAAALRAFIRKYSR